MSEIFGSEFKIYKGLVENQTFIKMQIFPRKLKFWSNAESWNKIEILVKKSEFWSKIEDLVFKKKL